MSDNKCCRKTKWVIAAVIIVCVLCVLITKIHIHFSRQAMMEEYQNSIRAELNTMQISLQEILNSGDKEAITGLALDYEHLGTIYACASSSLFSSYLDTGEWGNIARILLGCNQSTDLFQTQGGTFTEEEIAFLRELADYNRQLLTQITTDQYFRVIRAMSIRELEEVLNSHQLELHSFLYDTKP